MALIALFAALTAVGAFMSIPVLPVPFTFQVFFVLLAGALLGSLKGAMSQVVYILLGVVGLPVFAGGTSGIGVLVGPSGGYLLGFVAAAAIIGVMVSDDQGYWGNLIAMVIGVLAIYAFGLVQLMVVTKMGLMPALIAGVLKFVPFDLLKAAIAASLVQRVRPAIYYEMA